jgi:transcriptional regulator with XRE-family HTH domain
MNILTVEKLGMEKPLISVRLKTLRERAELTQQDLAVKAGLSVAVVSQIEQGKIADPRLSTLRALAEALGVDCNTLTEPDPKKPRPGGRK